ncbi:MAG: DUF72 domain-containing protein [Bdellovibrionota bacterium]
MSQIDLSLPVDDPRTWVALKRSEKTKPARIGIGAPAWGVKDWIGKVYPIGTQAKDFLHHYSRQFNSIELNSTHYSLPDPATIERWRDATPNGFKFNVKMLQDITHRGSLGSHATLVREFMANVLGLEDRLGFLFIQLPPTFAPDHISELRELLSQLPAQVNAAVEVRHPAFFKDHTLDRRLYDLLCEKNASVVITDVAGRRDVLHTSLTNGNVMVRFLANDSATSDDARIEEWVARIRTWLNLGLEQIEFFVHQPEDRHAPESISKLIERLNLECGLALQNWRPALQGTQLGLF